jgi:hypothetical protein
MQKQTSTPNAPGSSSHDSSVEKQTIKSVDARPEAVQSVLFRTPTGDSRSRGGHNAF